VVRPSGGLRRAQQAAMPFIGFLSSRSPAESAYVLTAFREAGFVEGQNLAIEYRWAAGDYGRLPALAFRRPSLLGPTR
jgi:putative tryptophan/tyrosine transport system substrate-binding protein